MAQYVDRVAEIPRLLDALTYHPEGLTFEQLAVEVGRTPDQVREALIAYYNADFADRIPDYVARPTVIEFCGGADDDEDDPGVAPRVRLAQLDDPTAELGVAMVPVAELAELYRVGRDRLYLEPGNALLAAAVDKLRDGLLPHLSPTGRGQYLSDLARDLRAAADQHRRVRISYARAWRPGVVDRVVEPYHLTQTRRGWELDAGPPDADGAIRTFLLTGIQHLEVLDETFEPPTDVAGVVRRQRVMTDVDITVPHELRWAVDKYAERKVALDETETTVTWRASFLPPVAERVGLVLLVAAGRASVISPPELASAGRDLARRLLRHHESYAADPS